MNTCVFIRKHPHKVFLARQVIMRLTTQGEYFEYAPQDIPKKTPDSLVSYEEYIYCPECRKRFLHMEAVSGKLFTPMEKKLLLCNADVRSAEEKENRKEALFVLGYKDFPRETETMFREAWDIIRNDRDYERLQCPHCHFKARRNHTWPVLRRAAQQGGSSVPLCESLWKNDATGTVTYTKDRISYIPGRHIDNPWISYLTEFNFTFNIRTKRLYVWDKIGGQKRISGICSVICRDYAVGTDAYHGTLDGAAECSALFDMFPEVDVDGLMDRCGQDFKKKYGRINLQILINKLMYPDFSDEFHLNLLHCQALRVSSSMSENIDRAFTRKLKRLRTSEDVLCYATHRLRVSNRVFSKTDRETLFENPMTILAYETAAKLGITDHDIIRENKTALLAVFCLYKKPEFEFLRTVFSKRWNTPTLSMIEKTICEDRSTLRDCANMYEQIRDYDAETELLLCGDLKDIRDTLSDTLNEYRYSNRTIPYTKTEKQRLESTHLGYTFYLPRNTHELRKAGKKQLHNNIDLYANNVISKNQNIVLAKQEGMCPEICIKLGPVMTGLDRTWALIGVKGGYNKPLNEEQARAFFAYMKASGIIPGRCFDLKELLERFGNLPEAADIPNPETTDPLKGSSFDFDCLPFS